MIFNTIRVMNPVGTDARNEGRYGLYWTTENNEEGGVFVSSKYICAVYGYANAIRVANGIAHEQAEYVIHPSPVAKTEP